MLTRRALLGAIPLVLLVGCVDAPPDGEDGGMGSMTTHAYGDDAAQVCDLHLPDGEPIATIVLVHGGFWQAGFDRTLQADVAADLVGDGYAVWNVDYRGVGAGGGFPATFEDLAAAVDLLADVGAGAGLDLDRVAIVGHSAGGHLALWAAGRATLPSDAVGASPRVVPVAAVGQAAVTDLERAAREGVGGSAVASVLGIEPGQPVPADLAAVTSPIRMLPLGVPQLLVSGAADALVPPSQSESYAEAAVAAGDDATLELVDGEDHFAQLDAASGSWAAVRAWLSATLD